MLSMRSDDYGKDATQIRESSRPFAIHLADGREIKVPYGEYISIQPGGRMFLMWLPEGDFELFNLTMVTSIKSAGK